MISGITTCRRLPSGKRASTNGCERSRRLPLHISARSTIFRTSSDDKSKLVNSLRPFRAINIRSGEFIQISSIVGSLINGAIAPNVILRSSSMPANLDWVHGTENNFKNAVDKAVSKLH